MKTSWQHIPLRSRVLFVAAIVYAAGLLVAAISVPVYRTTLGYGPTTSQTLVSENGWGVLGVVGLPLFGSLLVLANELARRHRGRNSPGTISYTVVGVIAVVSFLGALTVGLFFLPAPILLWLGLISSKGRTGETPTSLPPLTTPR